MISHIHIYIFHKSSLQYIRPSQSQSLNAPLLIVRRTIIGKDVPLRQPEVYQSVSKHYTVHEKNRP